MPHDRARSTWNANGPGGSLWYTLQWAIIAGLMQAMFTSAPALPGIWQRKISLRWRFVFFLPFASSAINRSLAMEGILVGLRTSGFMKLSPLRRILDRRSFG